jgi:hypothetical protein
MPIARQVCLHNHDPFIDPDSYEPQVMMMKRGGEKGRKHTGQAFTQSKQSCAHPGERDGASGDYWTRAAMNSLLTSSADSLCRLHSLPRDGFIRVRVLSCVGEKERARASERRKESCARVLNGRASESR